MKKLLGVLTILLFTVALVNAQDLVSKKGVNILPESGDMALGVSASTFLNFGGNLLNGTQNNGAPLFDYPNSYQAIYVKYFLSDNTAARAIIRIGNNSQTIKNYVTDDTDNTGEAEVEDKEKYSETNVVLGAGYEIRRGAGRVQGYYGAEAMVMLSSESYKYEFGNEMTSDNNTPTTTTNFSTSGSTSGPAMSRTTELKYGGGFGFGANAFIGVEYFFAPKISLGGEFGWGVFLASTGDGEENVEMWNMVDNVKEEDVVKQAGHSSMTLDTDVSGYYGNLMLIFHF